MIIQGLKSGPLPEAKQIEHFFLSSGHRNAYNIVQTKEREVLKNPLVNPSQQQREGYQDTLVNLRVIGYLFLFFPGPNHRALADVFSSVVSAEDTYLATLGEIYKKCFVRAFYKYRKTPAFIPSHPSRPSFDQRVDKIRETLYEAPKDYSDSKFKALIRDNFRCMISGVYEEEYQHQFPEDEVDTALSTEMAHVIPEGNYFGLDKPNKEKYAASILAVFDRFGFIIEKFDVHSLTNVMTMIQPIHNSFDRLRLWLESTDKLNEYKVVVVNRKHAFVPEKPITFKSTDPRLPLPDPQALELHAAACKVAHLSGAAEQFEKYSRDFESTYVLAEDGGSSAVLEHAFFKAGLIEVGA
ncbi:hypothetical protein GGU11DRAFT_793056 [Lentinula aff. detonsa]|nr:hypothetical protein GGU11DRAFT_793056 [Lentinula aff. detonsa]